MDKQQFIDLMETVTNSRHVAHAPWFYYVTEVEVIKDDAEIGLYQVKYHNLNFPKRDTLVLINKSDNKHIALDLFIYRDTIIDKRSAALFELRLQAMMYWMYKTNTFEAFFGFRQFSDEEQIFNRLVQEAYDRIRSLMAGSGVNLPATFMAFFKEKPDFNNGYFSLVLESGLELKVNRTRIINWDDQTIVSQFEFRLKNMKDENKRIRHKKAKVTHAHILQITVTNDDGRVTSHNELYSTNPEVKKLLDDTFAIKE